MVAEGHIVDALVAAQVSAATAGVQEPLPLIFVILVPVHARQSFHAGCDPDKRDLRLALMVHPKKLPLGYRSEGWRYKLKHKHSLVHGQLLSTECNSSNIIAHHTSRTW